ncbi:MAG: hypothetical protein WC285_05270 [Candidatus Gracilibacteria bacterium]|jgi:hypothetical protein
MEHYKTNPWIIVSSVLIALIVSSGALYYWYNIHSVSPLQQKQDTISKLTDLAYGLKIEDPESFSYPGCGIIHGQDGQISNWQNYDKNHLNNIYSFFNAIDKKSKLITLDYSQNPNNVSDEVMIVVCNCTDYQKIKSISKKYQLNFPDLLWHAKDTNNMQKDPMFECLGELQFP